MTDLELIDWSALADVLGGTQASYLSAATRGAVDGGIAGAMSGGGMLPFALASGPLTPATAGIIVGGSTLLGAGAGAVGGMWELYKARHPLELAPAAGPKS